MRIYLYGLILSRNAHRLPARVQGIAGATLRVIRAESLAALVGDAGDANAADLETVRAHDRVMRSVVRGGVTAIPVRFGQTFADDAELLRHLGDRATALAQILEEMDGFVEMRLLMALPEPVPPQPAASAPGRAYLESLRSSNRVAGLGLRDALGPVVRAERVEELPRDAGVAFAHLIRREDEASYKEAIASHPALSDGKLVGPLALYSFSQGIE